RPDGARRGRVDRRGPAPAQLQGGAVRRARQDRRMRARALRDRYGQDRRSPQGEGAEARNRALAMTSGSTVLAAAAALLISLASVGAHALDERGAKLAIDKFLGSQKLDGASAEASQ